MLARVSGTTSAASASSQRHATNSRLACHVAHRAHKMVWVGMVTADRGVRRAQQAVPREVRHWRDAQLLEGVVGQAQAREVKRPLLFGTRWIDPPCHAVHARGCTNEGMHARGRRTHLCARMHTYVHAYESVCVSARAGLHMCMCTSVCMHTCVHMDCRGCRRASVRIHA